MSSFQISHHVKVVITQEDPSLDEQEGETHGVPQDPRLLFWGFTGFVLGDGCMEDRRNQESDGQGRSPGISLWAKPALLPGDFFCPFLPFLPPLVIFSGSQEVRPSICTSPSLEPQALLSLFPEGTQAEPKVSSGADSEGDR